MTTRMPTEQRRQQIAEATMKIIGERGLREFTAAQVAAEVGIKDGTIFRHFKNKEEILDSVLELLEETLIESLPPMTADPLERLGAFFMSRLKLVAAHPGIQALVFTDQLSHGLSAQGKLRLISLRNRGRQFMHACLTEAQQRGLLKPSIKPEVMVLLVYGTVMGLVFSAGDGALEGPIEEVGGQAWEEIESILRR